MREVVCAAIKSRSVLQFTYSGGLRTVEPHCHGVSTAGNEVLRAWQTAGSSSSGKVEGWKLFEIGKISGLKQVGVSFAANRPGYNPDDSNMQTVHCRV